MAAAELVFARPGPMRDGIVLAGVLFLGMLAWLLVRWKIQEGIFPMGFFLLAAGFIAYEYYREPQAIFRDAEVDYIVSNRAFPMFGSEQEIPYASIRRLIQVPGRAEGPTLIIIYNRSGTGKKFRVTSHDIDSVAVMAAELSRRSGVPLENKWTY